MLLLFVIRFDVSHYCYDKILARIDTNRRFYERDTSCVDLLRVILRNQERRNLDEKTKRVNFKFYGMLLILSIKKNIITWKKR